MTEEMKRELEETMDGFENVNFTLNESDHKEIELTNKIQGKKW